MEIDRTGLKFQQPIKEVVESMRGYKEKHGRAGR